MIGRGWSLVNADGRKLNLNQLLFADNTAEERASYLVKEFRKVCKRRKLRVNEKSTVMQCTRMVNDTRMNASLNGYLFEEMVF